MSFVPRTIMIIEDDQNIVELLRLYLVNQGYRVIISPTGENAVDRVKRDGVDLVLLDLGLPFLDGWEIARALRQETDVSLIIETARGQIADKIRGFDMGADDYLVKPYDPLEVVARVKAVLKRKGVQPGAGVQLSVPGLDVNMARYEVRVNGHQVELTPKEIELLYVLASQPNYVFTREYLLQKVWGYQLNVGTSRTVDVHINRLRDKLERPEFKWRIKTVWGVGYKLGIEELPEDNVGG